MLDLLSRRPSLRLLLKALSKKEIHVPAYTKADGTYVPAHTKLVNYNPDHGAVLSGKSSHSHKEALKQAHKLVPGLKDLPAEHQSHIVQSHAQDIQTAASKAAQVSVFKKELLAGQKPKPANLAAFNELKETDPAKAAGILDAAKAALGDAKVQELLGPDAPVTKPDPIASALAKVKVEQIDNLHVYHGTTEASASAIHKDGFQIKPGQKSEGEGVYVTSNPKVADQYGEHVVEAKLSGKFAIIPSVDELTDNPAIVAQLEKVHGKPFTPDDWGTDLIPILLSENGHIVNDAFEPLGIDGVYCKADDYICVFDPKKLEVQGPSATKAAAAESAGPSAEEMAIAKDKLADIAAKAPGMHYPYLAWKKLSDDLKVWATYKNSVEKLQAVVDLAKQMQSEATAAAKVSTMTKKLAAGKAPSPSEMEAFAALDDAGKMKAVQSAHKKSGHKLTIEKLNELLDQGAAKAGITAVEAPKAAPVHFGQKHEGQVVGIPGKHAKFKFEGGKWSYWTGDGWNALKAAEWISSLNAGFDVLSKQPLEVVSDPSGNFGQKNEGVEFDIPSAPYTVKFEGGEWLFKYKDTKGGKQGEWHAIANDGMVNALNAGKQYGSNGISKDDLVPVLPQPDSALWGYQASDPGMSGAPSLTATSGKDGSVWQIVPLDPINAGEGSIYQVYKFSPDNDGGEPDYKDFASPERIQQYLQKQGLHPPELDTILKLTEDNEPGTGPTAGPQEGDTKQGVGGLLTLKDGHWKLDNAAMVSFFSKHAIKPGSATAIAATMTVAYMSEGKDASSVMAQLVSTKEAAKHQGFSPAQINDLINDLNDEYSKVLNQQVEEQTVAEGEEGDAQPSVSPFHYEHMLHNTTEGHNKFWTVVVDPEKATATTTWGKIGATKPQSKTYKHASAEAAYKAAKEAAFAKIDKGYHTVAKVDGKNMPAPKKSFGKENEGKVFSSVMSTGATGFYKYEGGHWNFTFDPKDGWNPVEVASGLHNALEQGKNTIGKKLLDLGHTGFGPAHEGKMFEATLSTGKKVVFKYENGQWHNQKTDDNGNLVWTPNVSIHWKAALEHGLDVNNNPLVEVGGDDFGPKHEGQLFTDGQADYKFEDGQWHLIVHGFDDWVPVPQGVGSLPGKLQQGLGSKGLPLQPKTGTPGAAFDDGPQEGDIKPGANGWLVLKDGHWVKASEDEALKKLCPVPESISSSLFKQALAGVRDNGAKWKKVATTKIGMPNVTLTIEGFGKFVGKASKGTDGVWTGWGSSMAGKNVADALNYLEHLKEAQKAIGKGKLPPDSPFAGQPAPAAPTAAPAAPKPAAAAPVVPPAPAGMDSIDGWKKVGGQGGFNEGGTYTDPQGDDWYCKFPAGGAKVARNELLANKLYEAAGLPVPEVKLVTQNGKIGLASRIVTGAKQDKAALEAGKAEGLLSGFVADAWLANWDVIGNNPAAGKGWDNIMFKQGIAYRIDPGGALLYGGAGGKKAQFGDTVIELETMRDPKVNARTAKVFGGISQADLKASAAKVLAISDSKIDQMVEQFGPGDASEKAALAKTLKARKADIAAKFPAVAKKLASQGPIVIHPHELKNNKGPKLDPKNLPVKVSDLPQPNDYMNWNGTGKPISDKPYVLQNIVDEKAIFDFAMKGNLVALKEYKFQPVDKMTGEPLGAPKPMEQHPSVHVRQYYDSVVQFLEVVANPMAPLELPLAKNVSTAEQLSECFPAFKYGKNISSVPSNHRLGFWFGLGFVEDPQALVPKVLGKAITKSAFAVALANWKKAPQIMRSFLKDVKSSGSNNQPYRDGKVTDHGGRNCREVLSACYDYATEHEEGTTIYKKISMPKAMVNEFLKQPVGLVFQNPGSMCCSRKKLSGFGSHVLTIHYAKGAKATDNMGWGTSFDGSDGKKDSEEEITSLAGARFMVMSRKMVGGDLHLELLMLPPDPTYVADLKGAA